MVRIIIEKIKDTIRYYKYSIKFKKVLDLDFTSRISNTSSFEGANRIGKNCNFSGTLGFGSYMGDGCVIRAKIGRFVSIGPGVQTNNGTHPFKSPFVTTSPMFYSNNRPNNVTFATYNCFNDIQPVTEIGNDCWIGQNVFLIGGIKISDGAVICAGAVVTKDVPPYAIVGGVPAKIIGYRYDDEFISFLTKICWWNDDISNLRNNWEIFHNITKFKDFYGYKRNI